jgi:hypothetical protein
MWSRNCLSFRSTRVQPGFLWGSCCLIFYRSLFVLFLLAIVLSILIRLLITPLLSQENQPMLVVLNKELVNWLVIVVLRSATFCRYCGQTTFIEICALSVFFRLFA